MSSQALPRKQNLGEEIANAISHGLGASLSILGMVVLIIRAVVNNSSIALGCAIVYASSLLILYGVSCAYHACPWGRVKQVLRTMDHCSIYLLILGSYVPIALLVVGGKVGWMLCIINALCAIIGITLNCFSVNRFEKFSLCLYVIMGWLVIFALKPLIATMPLAGIVGLVIGGLFYTVGIIFYKASRVKYMHFVWHLFVLAGSAVHFLVILYYCYPI